MSNIYPKVEIISRNKAFSITGEKTEKTWSKKTLPSKEVNISTYDSLQQYLTPLSESTNEIWNAIIFYTPSYAQVENTNYAPFGVKNGKLVIEGEGVFIIDLIHCETATDGSVVPTEIFIRRQSNWGTWNTSPFTTTLNRWVKLTGDVLQVYVTEKNSDYFINTEYASRSDLRIQVIGHFETPQLNEYTISNSLNNCTNSNSSATIVEGDAYSAIITPNENCKFTDTPYITMGDETIQPEMIEGAAHFNIENVTGNISVVANALRFYNLILDLYNCDLYDGEMSYTRDYVFDGIKYYFILKAHTDFNFKVNPRWVMSNDSGRFVLYDERKIAKIGTGDHELIRYIIPTGDLKIEGSASYTESLRYGFISIFNPTAVEANELAQKRFMKLTSQGIEDLDLSKYIVEYRKLYVDIPSTYKEIVYFGKYTTKIACNVVSVNFIEVDCGELQIEEINHNSIDYANTDITCYLPFIGSITLDPNQIFNHNIKLIYRVNPLNGDCVAIIESDSKQIAVNTGNVSFSIPVNYNNGNLNNLTVDDNPLYMASLTPYIEIKCNKIYDNDETSKDNNIWVQIGTCKGLVTFGEVNLTSDNNISNREKEEIRQILMGNVWL